MQPGAGQVQLAQHLPISQVQHCEALLQVQHHRVCPPMLLQAPLPCPCASSRPACHLPMALCSLREQFLELAQVLLGVRLACLANAHRSCLCSASSWASLPACLSQADRCSQALRATSAAPWRQHAPQGCGAGLQVAQRGLEDCQTAAPGPLASRLAPCAGPCWLCGAQSALAAGACLPSTPTCAPACIAHSRPQSLALCTSQCTQVLVPASVVLKRRTAINAVYSEAVCT